jgi:RNA polymerase sigma factor (sigma-70 family)
MSLAIEWPWPKKGENPMQYLDDVYRYSFARLRNREDAEDIAIEVVQALPNPCRRENLRIYMVGMARRKVADRLRRNRPTDQGIPTVAERFDAHSDEVALIEAAMNGISSENREILTLKYVVGLSSVEIGRDLGKSPAAVDSQLQRARLAFGQAWEILTSEEVKK